MTTNKADDSKAPKATELSDAEMTDVSGGFMNPEKGYGVKDAEAPKAMELTDADLDNASGGLLGDDIGSLVKGEKPKLMPETRVNLTAELEAFSNTTKK